MYHGQNRPSECHSKIFHSINYQFGPNFKVYSSPLGLLLLKNELHFCNSDKIAANLTLMQQFLTHLNPIFAQ